MALIQWALMIGMHGSIQPSMSAVYQPLSWLSLNQRLALSANEQDSFRVGELDQSIGTTFAHGWEFDIGHKSELSSDFKLHHLQFVQISFTKEFR